MKHEKPRFFASVGTWLDDHWIQAGLGICSLAFAACCLALSSEVLDQITDKSHHADIKRWAVRFLWVILFSSVVFWIFNLKQAKRLTQLEDEVDNLNKEKDVLAENVGSLIEGYLVNLASVKLGFGGQANCTERISLFSHDEAGGQFVLAARYSPSPTYRARRRSEYPDTQGCLATAWQTGSDFMDDMPDPAGSLDEYAAQQAAAGFPEAEARQLRMKSRLYYAYRVMDSRNRKPIAAVVVESTAINRFTRAELDQVFNNDERQFMSDLLEAIQKHLIVPSDAAKAGY
jgi:hypothetical protein